MKINIEYNIIIFIHIETEYIKLRFIYSAKLLLTKPKINNIITPTSTPTKYNFSTPAVSITEPLTSTTISSASTYIFTTLTFSTTVSTTFSIVSIRKYAPTSTIYYSSTLGELYRALTMDDFRRENDENYNENNDEIICDKFRRK
jgi:hypothetical protein